MILVLKKLKKQEIKERGRMMMRTNRKRNGIIVDIAAVAVTVAIFFVPSSVWIWVARTLF